MHVRKREAALDLSLRAHSSQIPAIRRAVAKTARGLGAGPATLMRVNLAITEAVTNAVVHAYRDRDPSQAGTVRVIVSVDDRGCLEVRIRDHGVGLSARDDSPGLGLGFGLMGHESHDVEVSTPSGGGTEIALRFSL